MKQYSTKLNQQPMLHMDDEWVNFQEFSDGLRESVNNVEADGEHNAREEPPTIQVVLTGIKRLGSLSLTSPSYSILLSNLPLYSVDDIRKLIVLNVKVNLPPHCHMNLDVVPGDGTHDGACIVSVSDVNVAVCLVRCFNGLMLNNHTIDARFIPPPTTDASMNSVDTTPIVVKPAPDWASKASTHRVFIGNLPYDSKFSQLKDFMVKTYGMDYVPTINNIEIPVKDQWLNSHAASEPACTRGFVVMDLGDKTEAAEMIVMLNGKRFMGRPLWVHYDQYPLKYPKGKVVRSFGWQGGPPVTYIYPKTYPHNNHKVHQMPKLVQMKSLNAKHANLSRSF